MSDLQVGHTTTKAMSHVSLQGQLQAARIISIILNAEQHGLAGPRSFLNVPVKVPQMVLSFRVDLLCDRWASDLHEFFCAAWAAELSLQMLKSFELTDTNCLTG